MEYNPLVSINVLTYNSAKYIIDALESVKTQTYKNIELIVSDDCSKDDTVQICKKWIDSNRSRFVNVSLITVEKNTGTSANCNRALSASKGEWLKQLAGDDALFPDSIENFIDFIRLNPDAKCILGNIREYKNTFNEENVVDAKHMHFHNNDKILEKSAEEQFRKIIHGNTFIPPAVIMNVQMMRDLGGYDEKYGLYEDTPFYTKMLKAGYKVYGLNKDILKYRTSDTNIYANTTYLFNFKHIQLKFMYKKDMCFPYYKRIERIRVHSRYGTYCILNKLEMRRRTKFNRTVQLTLHFLFAIFTLDVKMIIGYFSKVLKVNK